MAGTVTVFLGGDVMTGRGIDQILPSPGDPTLYEQCVRDAREYVGLAERAHGPIARPVGYEYIWGDALAELDRAGAEVRIVNLETSVTRSNEPWLGKPVLYRMHPGNIGCITAARIGCCCLANNHVLDWGRAGLVETLQTLDEARVRHAGAGRDAAEARSPAILDLPGAGRVLVFAFGSVTSGIPFAWAAKKDRSGVNLLGSLSDETGRRVAADIGQVKCAGDFVIASIHWGSNWGYDIPDEQLRFAHQLVEEGVDLVHGHSSHHVKAFEIYRGRLILYGCGDLLNDYEGIAGREAFRSDLALIYLVRVNLLKNEPAEIRLVPVQARRFRLNRASSADARWLCELLNDLGRSWGTVVQLQEDDTMTVRLM